MINVKVIAAIASVAMIIVGAFAVIVANNDQDEYRQNQRDYCQYTYNNGPRGDAELAALHACFLRIG